jgi:hypothetical protein
MASIFADNVNLFAVVPSHVDPQATAAMLANHLGTGRSGAGSAAEPSGAAYGLLSPLLVVHAVALQKPLPRFTTWTSG